MEKVEIEVYAQDSNIAVVRMPGRRFPGIVVQGDSLSILYGLATSILNHASVTDNLELVDEARELRELLENRLKFYETILQKHSINLPYAPVEWE
jgi:hypothetical protein